MKKACREIESKKEVGRVQNGKVRRMENASGVKETE